jgi:CelD/BcsL family acetyltransferase involved in cellulose biosynthesis
MALIESGASAPTRRGAAARTAAPTRLVVEQLGRPAFVRAAEQLGASLALSGFQASSWQVGILTHLAPAVASKVMVLSVQDPMTGACKALLPLDVRRDRGVAVAWMSDFGVCDYNAPLGGTEFSADDLLATLNSARLGIDLIRFERLLVSPANPLSAHPKARPSRMQGNSLTIIDGVDAYIRSRGKKYRKEIERCTRVLESHGAWSFARAETADDIAIAFAALERQQAARHEDSAECYALAAPQFAAFYRAALLDPAGIARIFTLTVNGEIIAVLLGIVHGATFTLLRIANGGDAWRHVSPGRLIVVEAMRYWCEHGVKTFDMGIGDYAFKRGFGAEPIALVDLVLPLTARGVPYATALRAKAALRRNQRVLGAVKAMKARFKR